MYLFFIQGGNAPGDGMGDLRPDVVGAEKIGQRFGMFGIILDDQHFL